MFYALIIVSRSDIHVVKIFPYCSSFKQRRRDAKDSSRPYDFVLFPLFYLLCEITFEERTRWAAQFLLIRSIHCQESATTSLKGISLAEDLSLTGIPASVPVLILLPRTPDRSLSHASLTGLRSPKLAV